MNRTHRILLWGATIVILVLAIFLPSSAAPHLRTIALLLTGLAGGYAIAYAVIGLASGRVRRLAAAGALVLAAGLFLVGAYHLPGAGALAGNSTVLTAGTLLFIVGLALQVRGS